MVPHCFYIDSTLGLSSETQHYAMNFIARWFSNTKLWGDPQFDLLFESSKWVYFAWFMVVLPAHMKDSKEQTGCLRCSELDISAEIRGGVRCP